MPTQEQEEMPLEVKKCIMYYMDPNVRVQTFANHPLLKPIHEATPLRIQMLRLSPNSMIVNDISFEYSCVLLHLNGQPLSPKVQKANKNGGSQFDVNKYGKELRDFPVKPGDLRVFGTYTPPFPGYSRKEGEFDVIVRCHQGINLTNGKYQHVRAEKRIWELMKDLTLKYFGENQCHVVQTLQISRIPGVYRLPVGLKLRLKELYVAWNPLESLQVFREIIHEDSFPLKILYIRVESPRDQIFRNDIVLGAEILRIGLPANAKSQEWWQLVVGLQHRSIQLYDNEPHPKEIIKIVRDWKVNPRRIGKTFLVHVNKVRETMFAIQSILGGEECVVQERSDPYFTTSICISVNDALELNLFARKTQEDRPHWPPFYLVMESMPRGAARIVPGLSRGQYVA